jgi:Uma2 family endonuclease
MPGTRTPADTLAQQSMWPPQGHWTYADYARLPNDGWRYDVIRGKLHMAPAPNIKHQMAARNIGVNLVLYVQRNQLGEVLFAPTDVILPDDLGTPVQPDLLFVARERLDIIAETRVEGAPDLVVEVLSPSNWLDDRREKYEVYETTGVREYWIVDPDLRVVEVYMLRDGVYVLLGKFGPGDTIRSQVLAGFAVAIDQVLPFTQPAA